MKTAAAPALMAVLFAASLLAEPQVTLTVRLYNAAGVSPAAHAAARAAAGVVLRETGLNVRFRQCGRRPTDDACSDPLAPSEVVVRIISAPAFSTTLHPEAFGVTYVVHATNRGWLATVFADRIETAAARARIDSGTLLGRVIAHEVGHLLLGVGYHGETGMMRAEWSDERLAQPGAEWRFSMTEAEAMHRALAPGAAVPPASPRF
jgi:hypothetical protein